MGWEYSNSAQGYIRNKYTSSHDGGGGVMFKRYGTTRYWIALAMLTLAISIIFTAGGTFAGTPVTSPPANNSASSTVQSGSKAGNPAPTVPFDCSQISRLGIDK